MYVWEIVWPICRITGKIEVCSGKWKEKTEKKEIGPTESKIGKTQAKKLDIGKKTLIPPPVWKFWWKKFGLTYSSSSTLFLKWNNLGWIHGKNSKVYSFRPLLLVASETYILDLTIQILEINYKQMVDVSDLLGRNSKPTSISHTFCSGFFVFNWQVKIILFMRVIPHWVSYIVIQWNSTSSHFLHKGRMATVCACC